MGVQLTEPIDNASELCLLLLTLDLQSICVLSLLEASNPCSLCIIKLGVVVDCLTL